MKIFTCDDFKGHYSVGTSAVIVANDGAEADKLLRGELKEHGLETNGHLTLREINITQPKAFILQDGDY
jgi:hypothetical protein